MVQTANVTTCRYYKCSIFCARNCWVPLSLINVNRSYAYDCKLVYFFGIWRIKKIKILGYYVFIYICSFLNLNYHVHQINIDYRNILFVRA